MTNFIEMNRASIEQRIVNAMIKRGDFNHLDDFQAKEEAEKRSSAITEAAYASFMQSINGPMQWVGTLSASMDNREFSALMGARDAAARAYFRTNEAAAIPGWLADAMGFSCPIDDAVGGDEKRLLQECGQALFGNSWKKELSSHLRNLDGNPLDPRRITHWLDGTRPIPNGVWAEMAALMRSRAAHQLAMADRID